MKNKTLLCLSTCAALVANAQAEDSNWNSSFDLGVTITSGNKDTSLFTLGFNTSKLESTNEYFADISYTYGENEGDVNSDELIASASWNHLATDTFYYGARFDLRHDELADIKYRAGITAVIGTYLIKNDTTTFAIEGGIGFTSEETASISDDYINAYFGDRYEYKFNEKTRIYQTLTITAPLDDAADFSLIGEIGIETFLSDSLALKVYFQDTYEAEPAAGFEKNDTRFVTAVTYKF
ncbi:MAG: DUF481 domain-containing protein [Akkermansiaceae bacterium]